MNKGSFYEALKYLPYITTYNHKVSEVSYAFASLTGYNRCDLCGLPVSQLFTLLRFSSDIDPELSCGEFNGYIFSSSSSPRDINIHMETGLTENEKLYVFLEKPHSRIEDKFDALEHFFVDNMVSIAIVGMPQMILLKANKSFLYNLFKPFDLPEESIGKLIYRNIKDWVGSPLEQGFQQVISTGKSFYIKEFNMYGQSQGSSFWNCSLTPVYEGSELKYCILILSEITPYISSRNQAVENASFLMQQNQAYEKIMENMSDALFVIDAEGKHIKYNKYASPWVEHLSSSSDINSCEYSLYDSSGKRLAFEETPFKKIYTGDEIQNFQLTLRQRFKETHLLINGVPVFNTDGEPYMGILCGRDITEHIQCLSSLKDHYNNLYNMLDTLYLPIIRISYPQMEILEVNKKAFNYFYTAEGQPSDMSETFTPESSLSDIFPDLAYGEALQTLLNIKQARCASHFDNVKFNKDGRFLYFNLICQPLFGFGNNISELLVIAMDVTHEVEQKEDLRRTLVLKDEFLSFMSHEFKTPLTVINAAVQALENLCRDELSEKSRGFIRKIRQNSYRQLRLVNNLLDISKANSGFIKMHRRNADIISITRAITESVILYARQKDITLHFHSTIDERMIAIDDSMYERIILNLLSNAIKFTPKGKSIFVQVSETDGYIHIDVADQGVGIPKDKQDIIFERFGQVDSSLTRSSEGTGIGLYLVKLLVGSLGGEIRVKSEEKVGSQFTIILPAVAAAEVQDELKHAEAKDSRLVEAAAIEFSDIYL